ncbi:MAG: hypothetical protein IKE74_08970 [Mogibacterium sp.]|nr:hypothetical protein [Mogibacterium sp.]
MERYIDVREIMGANDRPSGLFFDPVGPDRYAAMDRKRITESLFEEWYRKINQTNTRGIPEDIRQLYESATIALCQILTEEERIIAGRAE